MKRKGRGGGEQLIKESETKAARFFCSVAMCKKMHSLWTIEVIIIIIIIINKRKKVKSLKKCLQCLENKKKIYTTSAVANKKNNAKTLNFTK